MLLYVYCCIFSIYIVVVLSLLQSLNWVVCCVSISSGLKKKKRKKTFYVTKTKECKRKIKAFVLSFSLRIPDPYFLLESPRPLSPPQGHQTSHQLARNWLSHCPRDSQESFQQHDSKAAVLQHSAFFMVQLSHTELDHKRIGKEIRWLDERIKERKRNQKNVKISN